MFVCALIFLTCTCACKLSKFLRTLLLILFPVFPCEGTLAGAVDTPSAFIFTTFRMRRSSTACVRSTSLASLRMGSFAIMCILLIGRGDRDISSAPFHPPSPARKCEVHATCQLIAHFEFSSCVPSVSRTSAPGRSTRRSTRLVRFETLFLRVPACACGSMRVYRSCISVNNL